MTQIVGKSIAVALVAALGLFGLTACSEASQSSDQSAASITVPDLTGQTGDVAKKSLEDLGLEVQWDGGEKSVILPDNWTVDSTDPAAGTALEKGATVTVKVSKTQASSSASPTTDATGASSDAPATPNVPSYGAATVACENVGDAQYPYGFKGHWLVGGIADSVEGSSRFIKATATVENAYGNKMKDLVVECTVSGTEDAPVVDSFNVY